MYRGDKWIPRMHSNIQLFNSDNIDTLNWPNNEDGRYAEKFLVPLVKKGISHFIDNIHADIFVLKFDQNIFPIVVSHENYSNSWVCSPYAHYVSYGKEASGLVKNPLFAKFVKNLMEGFGRISQLNKMNSIVYVNNWMFSTDLYPGNIRQDHIHHMVEFLTQSFPGHTLVWRSLNQITNPILMESLENKGFHLIASRYVFITDTKNQSIFKTRILKSDLKLWKEHAHKIFDEEALSLEDCAQLMKLYHKLYVIQHSQLQPQFNHEYFKMLFKNKLLRFKVFKEEGIIKGVAGYYNRNQVMMCPIFGYEKNNQESNLVYRLLNTALLLEAQKEGFLFNQSAGASFFKSIRRAEGCLEYNAFYTKHLPVHRKLFWSALKFLMNRVGAKFMEKY